MTKDKTRNVYQKKVSRRRVLKIGSAFVVGGWVGTRAGVHLPRSIGEVGRRVVRTENCLNCTGCIAVCPQNVIISTANGPEIRHENCILCGYCVAICPVNGLKLSDI